MHSPPCHCLFGVQRVIHQGLGGTGVVAHWTRRGGLDRAVLARMSRAAPHRGEDLRYLEIRGVTVGVTAVDEPSGLGAAGDYAVAYAGVIDNPEALDRSAGHENSGDDAATAIAAAIGRVGFPATVAMLRGVFAIVATDGNSLWCARDQVGLTALFYRDDGSSVWVASEAKQIVAGAAIRREPNPDVLESIFFGLTHLEMPSALEGVARVPRHHALCFHESGKSAHVVFEPEQLIETSSLRPGDVPDAFHSLMNQAVRRVMRGADAISLSGGIDSPAVAAYAAPAHLEMFGTPLTAMSYVYPNHPSVDELRYIEPVAACFGLSLRTSEPRSKPTDGLANWVSLVDGPFPVVSMAESAEMCSWARSAGFSVLLTGEFAEFVVDADGDVLAHLLLNGRLLPAMRRLAIQRHSGWSGRALGRQVVRAVAPRSLARAYRRLQGNPVTEVRPEWIIYGPVPQNTEIPSRRRWKTNQVSFFGGAAILLEAHDILQARIGMRVRRPWADLDLWQFFLGLRAEVKHAYPTSKGLLRHLLRGRVPDLILDRRDKTVFDAHLMSNIDRAALAHWLVEPPHRMPWIDYGRLADAIQKPNLGLREFMWMKDLAAIHAFLSTW